MNIVLLGAQGAGKGIVSDYLSEKYNYKHISTGELIRKEIKENTEIGKKLASLINQGMLAPDEIVFAMLQNAMTDKANYIIDGFPRNMAQAKKLSEIANVDLVVFVNAPKEILMERLSARRNCPKCGGNFNLLFYKSDLCNKCGEKLQQRDDDVPEAISKRLEIFYGNINPILDFYKKQNKLVILENSGELQETYNNLEKIIKNYINYRK